MDSPDARAAGLAAKQHGVLAAWQCPDLRITRKHINHRLQTAKWHEVHRGVYAIGHPSLSQHGRYRAAVLAAGRDGALSHRSAASLWGLQPHHRGPIHVVSRVRRRPRRGIFVHWTRRLTDLDMTVRQGVPVTTLERTLIDLADLATPAEQEEAIRAAERLHGFDRTRLQPISGRRGTRLLTTPHVLTKGELELLFLRVLDDADLPRPDMNVDLGEHVIDALWRGPRVAAEIDDWDTHRHRDAFERDRLRDRTLTLHGLRPVRITHADLTDGRRRLVADLKSLGIG